ncbi:MAG TPA: M15 family metallopeptidase [Gemmatimonadaceae bacterium]|nr:M15 family metallopeptidase [Gemmatimonadaceae bacterium]
MRLDDRVAVGQSEAHLCSADDEARIGARVHIDAVEPFLALRADAAAAGFTLHVLSGFRSFERQLSIWNRKARGELALLDSQARPLDARAMSPAELVFAILRWSALPGASRHHWGTDIDVYDAAAKPAAYEVELIPAEVDPGGMFAPLHEWLDAHIAAGTARGFFRPYDRDRGGVAPERWHLSFAPVAAVFGQLMTPDLLRATIAASDIELKSTILDSLDEIHARFVVNVAKAPA